MREIGWIIVAVWIVQLVVLAWKSGIFQLIVGIILGLFFGFIIWH